VEDCERKNFEHLGDFELRLSERGISRKQMLEIEKSGN
jgi:hypothetical protein